MATAAVHGGQPHHFSSANQAAPQSRIQTVTVEQAKELFRDMGKLSREVVITEPVTIDGKRFNHIQRLVVPRPETDDREITPVDEAVAKILCLNQLYHNPKYAKQINGASIAAYRRECLIRDEVDLSVHQSPNGIIIGKNSAVLKDGKLDVLDKNMVVLFTVIMNVYHPTDLDFSDVQLFTELEVFLKSLINHNHLLNSIKIENNLNPSEIEKLSTIIVNHDNVRKQLSILSSKSEIYASLGKRLLDIEKFKLAIVYFTKALQLDPNNVELLKKRGLAYMELKDYASSKKDFEACLKINPKYHDAMVNIGIVYTYEKNLDAALQWTAMAHQIAPKDPDVIFNMIMTLLDIAKVSKGPRKEKVLASAMTYAKSALECATNERESISAKELIKLVEAKIQGK